MDMDMTDQNGQPASTAASLGGYDAFRGFPALMAARADVFRPFMTAADAIMKTEGQLTKAEREVIATFLSDRAKCSFCAINHAAIARTLGEDPAASGAARQRALLDVAAKVADGKLSRADVEAAAAAGLDEAAVEESVLVAALFGFLNQLVSAYGFQATDAMAAQMAPALAKSYAETLLGKA